MGKISYNIVSRKISSGRRNIFKLKTNKWLHYFLLFWHQTFRISVWFHGHTFLWARPNSCLYYTFRYVAVSYVLLWIESMPIFISFHFKSLYYVSIVWFLSNLFGIHGTVTDPSRRVKHLKPLLSVIQKCIQLMEGLCALRNSYIHIKLILIVTYDVQLHIWLPKGSRIFFKMQK